MADPKTTSMIRRLISKISFGQMFATRDCLNFGPRTAVDQALFRMVRDRTIVRLARGVFTKVRKGTKLPTLQEIALFKAKAFQRRAHQIPRQATTGPAAFNFSPRSTPLATDGASSSFGAGIQRLYSKGRAPRKVALGDSPHGLVIRALWELGKAVVTPKLIATTLLNLGREDRANIKQSCHIMPAWLADLLVWNKYKRDQKSAAA